jgi:hypothetical protein
VRVARRPLWLALAGTVCIFGGELFCLLDPLQYERLVHVACHVIFYTGIVAIGFAVALRWRQRPQGD